MRTTHSGCATLALAATVLVGVSGCGGGKGLTRSELIAKADAICRRANTTLDSAKIGVQNVVQVAPQMAAVERQVSAELGKLTPPSSMAADWKIIVDGFRRAGAGLQKVGEAAKTIPLNAKKHVVTKPLIEGERELNNGQNDRAEIAGRNGFTDCAKF